MEAINLLNPLAFLFAGVAGPIILLYVLRLRRREQRVSSTLLWRQVVMDREANSLWQRLRPNILLLLQLLTLAFLVFAMTRPYAIAPAILSGRTVVLLDASASMAATDVDPSRFEAARREVRQLIEGLGANNEMTVILVDGSPRALSPLTSNRPDLIAALEGARTSLSSANWSAALALAGALRTESTSLIVIGDGANSADLQTVTIPVRFIAVGGSGGNVAISALAVRRTLRGVSALTRVTNFGTRDATVLLSLRAVDGTGSARLVDAREFRVGGGQSAQWTVNDIDSEVPALRAAIDSVTPPGANTLASDDSAYAINAAAAPRRALLLGRGNRFVEQAFGSLPNLQLTRAVSMPTELDRAFDLIIVDGISATLPARSRALFIAPIADTPVFSVGAVFSATAFAEGFSHPMLRGVDWRGINILDGRLVNGPAWLRPIVTAQGGPLVMAGEPPPVEGTSPDFERLAIISFDLRRSDLPLQIAFPVLIANTVEWLAPLRGLDIASAIRPGEVVALPQGATVINPSGQQFAVDARGFAATSEPGIYGYASGGVNGRFAVNFISAQESGIAPAAVSFSAPSVPGAGLASGATAQREIWPVLAGLALAALMVEWWIYQRGVPSLRRGAATKGAR